MSAATDIARRLRVSPVQRAARLPAWVPIGLLLLAAGIWLMYLTRGEAPWFDEWMWITGRRGGGAATYLDPHNGHLSLVPIVIYKALFASVGIDSYAPYRVMVIGAHLATVALLWVYARRRVSEVFALCAAALLLFLGPAFQNVIWAFSITYLLSLAGAVAAFVALDRRTRGGDVAAALCFTVALASSGIALPFIVGIAIDVAFTRPRRQWWIAWAPLLVYALWWLAYQDAQEFGFKYGLFIWPSYLAQGAAGTLSSLTGLSGATVPAGQGTILAWGPPLALIAVALVIWRFGGLRGATWVRPVALLASLIAFWLLIAFTRAFLSPAYASRYLYVSGLIVLLLAVELARGVVVSRRVMLLVCAGVAAACVSNIGVFRDAGRYMRAQGAWTRADLGAVEVAGDSTARSTPLKHLPGFPLVVVTVGQYLDAKRDLGTPATPIAKLPEVPEQAREAADAELVSLHGVRLQQTAAAAGSGAACRAFTPPVGTAVPQLQVTVPPSGAVTIAARGGTAAIAVRRYADAFTSIGRVPAGSSATLRIPRDRSPQPWRLRLTSSARATICGTS